MREILVITYPHGWITVQNAVERMQILEEVIEDNHGKEIVIVGGVFDRGFATATNAQNREVDFGDVATMVNTQVDRYFALCQNLKINTKSIGLLDIMHETRAIGISGIIKKSFLVGSRLLEQYAMTTGLILANRLSTQGRNIKLWPKDIIFKTSVRQEAKFNKKTEKRVAEYLLSTVYNANRSNHTSMIIPVCGYNISKIPLSLNRNAISELGSLVKTFHHKHNFENPLFSDSIHVLDLEEIHRFKKELVA
jgi:hypothetical protein